MLCAMLARCESHSVGFCTLVRRCCCVACRAFAANASSAATACLLLPERLPQARLPLPAAQALAVAHMRALEPLLICTTTVQPQHPHPLRLAHPTPHRLVRARAKTLFIVESPTKAAKVSAFLGKDYDVHASFGHFRQLPRRAGAVRPEDGFELDWEVMPGRREQLGRIEASAKSADALVLATDPDREGEAISWHMLEYLRVRACAAALLACPRSS